MKKSIRLFLAIASAAVLLTSCGVEPTAEFTFEPMEVSVYDEVSFTNASSEADSYAWDFGDGTTSTEENPTHMYTSAGTFIVTLVATNDKGEHEVMQTVTVEEIENTYSIDGTVYYPTEDMFWYQSGMGGDPYIRLITEVTGQDNPDLLKLYPNRGVNALAGTYTWDGDENPPGTYDHGYTAGYAGMGYDWTSIGKTGSSDLVITEVVEGIYNVTAELILSVGTYDFQTGEFTETDVKNLSLDYTGAITPL